MNGSIVLFPVQPPAAATPAAQKRIALSILGAMVECGVLQSEALDIVAIDKAPSAVTSEIFGQKPGKGVAHVAVEPELLLPTIGELVHTDTAKSFWGERDKKKQNLVGVPFLDVSVLAKPQKFHDADAKLVAETNVVIEFSYADARLSPKIHKLKTKKHRLIEAFEDQLASKIDWCVVSY